MYDEYYKYLALNEIAKFQAQSGDFAQAKKSLEMITGFPKSTVLPFIATEQVKAGDRSGALETLDLILSDKLLVEKSTKRRLKFTFLR